MSDVPTKFPHNIYVSHYDHSREDSISLNADITKEGAVNENGPTLVATYVLNKVSLITKKIEEEEQDF